MHKIKEFIKSPLGKSVSLHIIILCILMCSFSFSASHDKPAASNAPPSIQATTVPQSELNKIADAKRKAQEAKQAAAAKAKRLAAQKAARIKAQKLAAQKAAKLKAQKIALAKKQAAQKKLAAKAKQEKIAKDKKIADQKAKQQKIAQDKKAAEKKAVALKAAKDKQAKLAAAKAAKIASAKEQARIQSEAQKYTQLILGAIEPNWRIPKNVNKKDHCTLLISLSSNGTVLKVTVQSPSADPRLDRSAVAAVYSASPLPVPNDPKLTAMFSTLELTMRPEDITNAIG